MKINKKNSSSRSQMLFKIVLKDFAIFTGKHLCWSLFLKACNSIKKRLRHRCFLWILRNCEEQLFIENIQWLLLKKEIQKRKSFLWRSFKITTKKEKRLLESFSWNKSTNTTLATFFLAYFSGHPMYKLEKF